MRHPRTVTSDFQSYVVVQDASIDWTGLERRTVEFGRKQLL